VTTWPWPTMDAGEPACQISRSNFTEFTSYCPDDSMVTMTDSMHLSLEVTSLPCAASCSMLLSASLTRCPALGFSSCLSGSVVLCGCCRLQSDAAFSGCTCMWYLYVFSVLLTDPNNTHTDTQTDQHHQHDIIRPHQPFLYL